MAVTVRELVYFLKGATKMSKRLRNHTFDVMPPSIQRWVSRNIIPPKYHEAIRFILEEENAMQKYDHLLQKEETI